LALGRTFLYWFDIVLVNSSEFLAYFREKCSVGAAPRGRPCPALFEILYKSTEGDHPPAPRLRRASIGSPLRIIIGRAGVINRAPTKTGESRLRQGFDGQTRLATTDYCWSLFKIHYSKFMTLIIPIILTSVLQSFRDVFIFDLLCTL